MKHLLENCCSDEWREFLNFHAKEASFKKGEYLFRQKNTTLGLYTITEGMVKVTVNEANDGQRVIRLANTGDIVGHRGFAGDWRYPINAICYTDTTLKFIPLKIVNTMMKTNAQFSYHLMMFFAEELRDSEFMRSTLTVKQRIAWVLIKNLEVFGTKNKKLKFTIPRKDIASFALTTYESTIRTLRDLSDAKIIELDNKDIIITSSVKLKEIIKAV